MRPQNQNNDPARGWRTLAIRAGLAFALVLLSFGALAAEEPGTGENSETASEESLEAPAEGRGSGWKVSGWGIQTSFYTKHWDPEPEHTDHQHLIGPELYFENDYLVGLAIFQNSFDQSSQFLYIGKTWPLFKSRHFYFKLVGGLLHGYKEPYEDKIPLNGLGVAPAILPSLGFRYKWFITEVQIAGTAAITITGGLRF